MKKALVFGGNGFLGKFVVKELCEGGFNVLIASRGKEESFKPLKTIGFPGQIAFKRFDASKDDINTAFNVKTFDVVINLIGIGEEKSRGMYYKIHVEFPFNIAVIAKKFGVQFIHVSAFFGGDGFAEGVNSRYLKTKKEGVKKVLKNNPNAIIICPSVMIGKGGSLVQTFESLINILPFLPVMYKGKTKIQPVFVGDVARFIFLCINQSKMQGKLYNLAGKEVMLFKDFLARVMGFMNKKRRLIPVPFFIFSFIFWVKKLLPSFILRTSLTKDLLELAGYRLIVEKNDLTKLIKNPHSVDSTLNEILAKYKLYD